MTADLFWKVTIAGVGAAWTLLNYFQGRSFSRRLEIKVSGEILEREGHHFLSVVATIHNVGLTKAFILKEGTWIKVFRLQSIEAVEKLGLPSEIRLGTGPIFEHHSWVEPGEEVSDVAFLQLPPKTAQDIAVRVEFRVRSWETVFFLPTGTEEDQAIKEQNGTFRRYLKWVTAANVSFTPPPVETTPNAQAGVQP